MIKIEPLEQKKTIPDIINSLPVNGEVQINANRIASFKATVNRINSKQGLRENRFVFSYTEIKNDYCVAKRIA